MSITVEYTKVEELVTDIFHKSGLKLEDAKEVAHNLTMAEMRGVKSHGLVQVANYSDKMRRGIINTQYQINKLTDFPSATSYDADFGPGAVAGKLAIRESINKAKQTGVAVTTVKNGTHFGMAAYFAVEAAKENLIGLAFTNAGTLVAPFNGYGRELGTNPICIAVPSNDKNPVIFDAATSNAAFNKIFFALTEHKTIPDSWALDQNGHPTTNPEDVIGKNGLLGALVPFGDYKGYGLAIMVNILTGLLSGGSTVKDVNGTVSEDVDNVDFNLAAIDISKFTNLEDFKQTVSIFMQRLKNSKHLTDVDPIRIPGEIEDERYENSKHNGIVILDGVEHDINQTAAALGIQRSLKDCILG